MFTFTSEECSAIGHVLGVADQAISSGWQDIARNPVIELRDPMEPFYQSALAMMIQAIRPLFERARNGGRCGLRSVETGEGIAINALDESDLEAFAIIPHAIAGAFSLVCLQAARDEQLERSRQVVRRIMPRIQSAGYANYVAGAPLHQYPQASPASDAAPEGASDAGEADPEHGAPVM